MEWKTRLTELLGCEYPILQGALSRIGNWKFAAAVSNAGAHGTLTAAVSLTPERLRDDIRRLREATDRPCSVNITVGMCPHIDEMLEVCLEEGVEAIETAVFNADQYGRRIKEAGRKWIHKTATIRHALHAEKQGADAVILVGLEGIGFKNASQLPTMTTIAWAARQIEVPIVAAGGIGDARTFLASLALGAEGEQHLTFQDKAHLLVGMTMEGHGNMGPYGYLREHQSFPPGEPCGYARRQLPFPEIAR